MDQTFYSCLYSERSLLDVISEYSNSMITSSNPIKRMKAKALKSFHGTLADQKFEKVVKDAFYILNKELGKSFPDTSFLMMGRRKSLISLLNKCEEVEANFLRNQMEEFAKQHNSQRTPEEILAILTDTSKKSDPIKFDFIEYLSEKELNYNPFGQIHDLFAFRICVVEKNLGEKINETYQIANVLLHFFDERSNFEIVPNSIKENDEKPSDEIQKEIFVPKESGIEKKYRGIIKDYVLNPKKDGYQGIHILIRDPDTNRDFEVQIRTSKMDMISISYANHDFYKREKYHDRLTNIKESIDFSKIHISGFEYKKFMNPMTGEESEAILDYCGLVEAIPISFDIENLYKIIS